MSLIELSSTFVGTAPAIADIMGGHADLTFSDPSVLPQVKSGKLKAIGVSGKERYEPLPQVPVIAQSGLPGFDAINWYPMMAPGGTSWAASPTSRAP